MKEQFIRSALLLGEDGIKRLNKSHVAVFGIGGVGSFVAEALARAGVGALDFFDSDTVSVSNINRQLIATHKSVGQNKVDVMKERALDINPDIKINAHCVFYSSDNADMFDLTKYSYIVDAIDSVTSKLLLIKRAKELNIPIISCMGAGNKLDATGFEVADISKTSVCPLARVMRRELGLMGIKHLKVVYSKEPSITPKTELAQLDKDFSKKRSLPGSVSYVPSTAGLIIAGEVIRDIAQI